MSHSFWAKKNKQNKKQLAVKLWTVYEVNHNDEDIQYTSVTYCSLGLRYRAQRHSVSLWEKAPLIYYVDKVYDLKCILNHLQYVLPQQAR